MDHDDFANVTWQSDQAGHEVASSVGSPGAEIEGAGQDNTNGRRHPDGPLGNRADSMDLAGVGEGTLECTVTAPIKENDGTKDAYVSYLVTTNVGWPHEDWSHS
jgi:sorting nexin-4